MKFFDANKKLAETRSRLGPRRFHIAMLWKVECLTQVQIAERMGVSQPMICKDIQIIKRVFAELKSQDECETPHSVAVA